MIVVALGTHPQPMDRLLQELDRLVDRSRLSGPILVQTAAIRYRPRHARVLGVVDSRQLEDLMSSATTVIVHGGPGLIFQALALGHRPVVVPRLPEFGEHVDDHQVRFTRWLRERKPIVCVLQIRDLGSAILTAGRQKGEWHKSHGPSKETVEIVRRLLEDP